MSWTINVTLFLLTTTLSGSLAQIIWFGAKWILERNGYLSWCYKGLWAVALFYLMPSAYIGMIVASDQYSFWAGALLLPTQTLINICTAIVVLWVLGTAVLVCLLIRDVWNFGRLQRVSASCRQWEQALFEETCESLGISAKRIRLYRNVRTAVPSFGGILHPMVLIPEIEFTREQLHTVLLHELIHYQQRASWLIMIARIVKVVQCFNPLAWRLEFLVEKWAEFDCDERACTCMGNRKNYFCSIIEVMEIASESGRAMAVGLTKNKHEVEERIQYMKKFGKRKKRSFGIVTLLVVFLMGTYSLTVAAASDGIGDLYLKCYQLTVVDIVEEPAIMPEWEEYVDDGPEGDVIVEEGEVRQETRSGYSFDWTVRSGALKHTSSFSVAAGQKISVDAYIKPGDKNVRVGIIDSAGKRRYILGSDEIHHSFSITSTGTYSLFVENTNSVDVQVEGSYTIR